MLGDAIGNYTLLLDRAFKLAGIDSKIYAINIGKGLSQENICPYDALPILQPQDIVIYHMCESTTINADIKNMNCKKIAIYHNATPAHFFARYEPGMCQKQALSIHEIQDLNGSFDWCIADSAYNKDDLVRYGYDPDKITVIPVLLDFDDYRQTPDKKVIEKYSDGFTNLLFVGRVVPNKKQEDIVRIFAWYKKHINPRSRLILIGAPFGDTYINSIREYIQALDLSDVIFPGHISFAEILAFYRVADIFLCMSEHEGFCVPLVEAMMFDVPIIAYASSAIPDTLGDAGVLIDEKDPVLVSKIIDQIVSDPDIRRRLIDIQRERLKDFHEDIVFEKIYRVVSSFRGEDLT